MRLLQSPITVLVAACLAFFVTMFLTLHLAHLGNASLADKEPVMAEDDPSWKFHNPDIDQWVSQIKSERDSLAVREQQLKDWEARLAAESREIAAVTQAVTKTQQDFDQRVVLFTSQERDNVKKQLKVIANMTPEGAVAMMNELPDDEVVRLLYSMKADNSAAILDTMSKQGPSSARRAGVITDKIKQVLPTPATNNLTANAGR